MLYATARSVYLRFAIEIRVLVIAGRRLAGVLTLFITSVPSSLGLKQVTLTCLSSRCIPLCIAIAAAIRVRLLMTGHSILWMFATTRL